MYKLKRLSKSGPTENKCVKQDGTGPKLFSQDWFLLHLHMDSGASKEASATIVASGVTFAKSAGSPDTI